MVDAYTLFMRDVIDGPVTAVTGVSVTDSQAGREFGPPQGLPARI
jgi:hypothetical protein